jgi:diguanylate cyclase (GGDEF)-like protein
MLNPPPRRADPIPLASWRSLAHPGRENTDRSARMIRLEIESWTLVMAAACGYAWLAHRVAGRRSGSRPLPLFASQRASAWTLLACAVWLAGAAAAERVPGGMAHTVALHLAWLASIAVVPLLVFALRRPAAPVGTGPRLLSGCLLLLPGIAAGAPLLLAAPLAPSAVMGLQAGYTVLCLVVALALAQRRYAQVWRGRLLELSALGVILCAPPAAALLGVALADASIWNAAQLGLVLALPLLAWLLEANHAGIGSKAVRLANALGSSVILVDEEERVIDASASALALLGAGPVRTGTPLAALGSQLSRALSSPHGEEPFSVRTASGERCEIEPRIRSIGLGRGRPEIRALSLREISQKRDLAQRIRRMAYFDDLTGIPNRRSFLRDLSASLQTALACGTRAALLYLDLDGFKEINDSLGHEAGDEILRVMSQRLRQNVRTFQEAQEGKRRMPTRLARLGGDEFALLLEEIGSLEEVEDVAQHFLKVAVDPLWVSNQEVSLSLSAGIAVYPFDADGVESLLRKADSALYHAKQLGRNRYAFFESSFEVQNRRKLELKQSLAHALGSGEFELHYQPKVDLETEKVIGAEALLRWTHPKLGAVGPSEFIPIAEMANLIKPIGAWVVETACKQIAAWREQGLDLLPISVNVSSYQITDGLSGYIARVLRDTNVEPALLEIELTESAVLANSDVVYRCLAELRAMGIRIAIDDFGTGYSALSYLSRIQIDTLKIDRSLARGIADDPRSADICRAVISMAHSLGLRVVAEGLDAEEQVIAHRKLGCDEAQGFYFGAGVSADAFARCLRGDAPASQPAGEEAEAPAALQVEAVRAEAPEARLETDAPLTAEAEAPAPDPLAEELESKGALTQYAMMLDDVEGTLGSVALELTRLGVLVLYTPFSDEAALLARQERGNIRLIVISPWTDLELVRELAAQLAPDLEGVPPPIVVTGPKPDEDRRARLRDLGVAWALWSPADLEEVRFIVTTAMVLPSEQWRRKEQRVPANLPVAINGPGGPKLGRLLSLSAGGAFVATDHLPDPGTRLRLGFYLDGDDVELDAEVVHVTPRPAAWTASFPRGIGIAFADLTPETADEIREWVKRQLEHYAV